jgi:hypothetical protein
MGGVSKASVEATLTTKLQPVHLVILRVLFSLPFITGFVFLLWYKLTAFCFRQQ